MAEGTQPDPSSHNSTTPAADSGPKAQVPVSGFQMHPFIAPGIVPIPDPGQVNGPGIYAIPYSPYMGSMAGFYPNTLIPLRYNIPTGQDSGGASNEQGHEPRQQPGPQRQAVPRRFHLPFPLDLGLIIKLGAMIFLFSQDGSPNRLVLLIFFASLVYLYQTGLLAPFIQWLQQAGAPPRPRAPVRPQNGPPAAIDAGNDGVDNPNQNQPVENQEQPDANGNNAEAELRGNNFVQMVREIRMFVVGFLTSLFPGFNNNN